MPSQARRTREYSSFGRLARVSWLVLLCVLALSPAAIAGQQGSSGLAVLLRELLCGCASCNGELDTGVAEQGCCERLELPVLEEDCGGNLGCACTHPDEVPLGESTPLSRPEDSRRAAPDVASLAFELASTNPHADALTSALECVKVACRPPPGRLQAATHERCERSTRERLAWLATCLI